MIEWTRAQRSEAWSARLDGRLLATVGSAGIDWAVCWQGITDDAATSVSFPLRETAIATVETRVLRLISEGSLTDLPGAAGEEGA